MKAMRFLAKIGCCLAVCAGLAGADSIQLRNGRHLQGKYIGGTTTTIGFMTASSVEYFATADVLMLMFDSASAGDSPLGGLPPNPLHSNPMQASPATKVEPASQSEGPARLQPISASQPNRVRRSARLYSDSSAPLHNSADMRAPVASLK